MKTKILIAFLGLILPLFSHADSEYTEGFPTVNNASFRSRFILKGELYVVDSSGTRLMSPTTEIHEWLPGKNGVLDNHWNVKSKGFDYIAIHHTWTLRDDNSVEYKIQQYKDHDNHTLIKEDTQVLHDFAPVSWVVESNDKFRVILRFTPQMEEVREETSLTQIPIGGDRGSFEVTDNQGYLWSENVRFGGQISGIKTHRGSFIISLYPFKDAKVLGSAAGKLIELNLTDSLKVKVRGDVEIVPDGMRVPVYGKYLPKLKSDSFKSTSSFGQRRYEDIPKEFL